MQTYKISKQKVSLSDFVEIVNEPQYRIEISDEVLVGIKESRALLKKYVDDGRVIYGVNTSMGGFVNYLVPIEFAEQLQNNLISSVASNVGEYLDDIVVRAAMLARIISLSKGASAISEENFNILVELFNKNILPCIPCKGSLGASGDLGPLAFIALVATGKWKAKYDGEIISGEEALKRAGIKKMVLSYKEGLALINGTSAMVGLSAINFGKAHNLLKIYEFVSALSFEGLRTKMKPLNPKVHQKKMHKGQNICAEHLWKILSSSKLVVDEQNEESNIQKQNDNSLKGLNSQIEDAYSLRCTPQILGPIYDSLDFVSHIIEDELNSSSDNPLILVEENDVFHNGHFHGQYISMAMDYLSICLTVLSNLSDRRIDRFMDKNNSNGLPPFLCRENPGLRLGLMGGQFMSTSITAENRSLCTPLSIQSLTSTGDFQDIVSFGFIAARRCQEILQNAKYVVSFELLCACQAVDIVGSELMSDTTRLLYDEIRKIVPYLSYDVPITPFVEKISELLSDVLAVDRITKVIID